MLIISVFVWLMYNSYEEGGYEKGDRKGKVEVKARGMGICDIKILEEETAPIEFPFHLFWRE